MSKRSYYPGSGDVKIIIGDEEVTLRPTLEAGLALSRQAGGFRLAMQKIVDLDLDMIASVIRLGVGREEARRLKNLDRMIYENGLLDSQGEVVVRCIEYLANLSRGGRPADDEGAEVAADADPTKTQPPAS